MWAHVMVKLSKEDKVEHTETNATHHISRDSETISISPGRNHAHIQRVKAQKHSASKSKWTVKAGAAAEETDPAILPLMRK